MKPAPAVELPPGLKCPLLENIPPSELNTILVAATRRRLTKRKVLLHAGDPATVFFILLSGQAHVYTYTETGQRIIMARVEPGETIGAAALLPKPSHYLFTTEVIEDGEALEWQRPVIRGLLHSYPALADNVLSLAAQMVQRTLAQRVDAVSQSAEQRLAGVLLDLVRSGGSGEAAVTNEQLAELTNTSPFTVARILSAWSRSGVIRRSRGRVEIRSIAKLAGYQQAVS